MQHAVLFLFLLRPSSPGGSMAFLG